MLGEEPIELGLKGHESGFLAAAKERLSTRDCSQRLSPARATLHTQERDESHRGVRADNCLRAVAV